MKRKIAIGLFVNAVLLALVVGLLSMERMDVALAAGGGGVPVGNGDVNGDGGIDISDAVYTLTWLYMGGDAPVPYESSKLLERIVQLEADLAAETTDLAAKTTALEECSSGLSTVQTELASKTTALDACVVWNCPPIVKWLPATGQETCYDTDGFMVACGNPSYLYLG